MQLEVPTRRPEIAFNMIRHEASSLMGYYVTFTGKISADNYKQRRVFVYRVKQLKQQRSGRDPVGEPGGGSFTGT